MKTCIKESGSAQIYKSGTAVCNQERVPTQFLLKFWHSDLQSKRECQLNLLHNSDTVACKQGRGSTPSLTSGMVTCNQRENTYFIYYNSGMTACNQRKSAYSSLTILARRPAIKESAYSVSYKSGTAACNQRESAYSISYTILIGQPAIKKSAPTPSLLQFWHGGLLSKRERLLHLLYNSGMAACYQRESAYSISYTILARRPAIKGRVPTPSLLQFWYSSLQSKRECLLNLLQIWHGGLQSERAPTQCQSSSSMYRANITC